MYRLYILDNSYQALLLYSLLFCPFSIFAQASLSVTVRLKTSAPGAESESTQKYPCRSNWKRLPAAAVAKLGSTLQTVSTSSELGFNIVVKSSTPPGSGTEKSW